MAFEASDFLNLVRLLEEHPEWRTELRRLLLTNELLALPELVRELVEAQRRAEGRVGRVEEELAKLAEAQRRTEEQVAALAEAQRRTEEQVAALAEAQRHLEQRVSRVEEELAKLAEAQRRTEEQVAALAEAQRHLEQRLSRVEEELAKLAEAQRRTEEQVAALAEAQRHLEQRVSRVEEELAKLAEAQRLMQEALYSLAESHRRLVITVGDLKGRVLEQTYRDKAHTYFGTLLRRLRIVHPYELEESLRPHLSEQEFFDLLYLDLLVRGQPRRHPELSELWLAVEISSVMDIGDVERVERRAAALHRAGYAVIPVVAGEHITEEAREVTRRRGIVVLQDGQVSHWDEAVRTWLNLR